jgi:Fur family ferric uptake transcriptional regulator
MIMIINSIMGKLNLVKDNFKKFISDRGLRNTTQRDEIIEEIVNCGEHTTAEQIYEHLKKKNPKIGFATICRNLRLLCEAGLLDEIKIGNQKTRYELKSDNSHHDHLICLKCGKFIEVFSEKLEKLQSQMARKEGFKVLKHKLEIYGICKDCLKG